MLKIYKTKETAIKKLLADEGFENKVFDLFKNDKEVVLIAVKKNGLALEYVSKDLKNDKDVVLTAIKQNSYALKYASYELRNDKEVVLIAVGQKYGAIEYASTELKNDKEVVLKAIKQDAHVLSHISDDFYSDKDILYAAKEFINNDNNDKEYHREWMDKLKDNIKRYEGQDARKAELEAKVAELDEFNEKKIKTTHSKKKV